MISKKLRLPAICGQIILFSVFALAARSDSRTYTPPPRTGTIYIVAQFRPYQTGDRYPKTKIAVNWGNFSRTEAYGLGFFSLRTKLGFVIRLQHKSNDSRPLVVESEGHIVRIEQLDTPPSEWDDSSNYDRYAWGSCGDDDSIVGNLTQVNDKTTTKIPLILIHGIHGTEDDDSVMAREETYWKEFIRQKWNDPTTGLSQKYELFVFKYCSDRVSVKDIADVLGREIDEKLNQRPHVILAHSMGGLIAKAYMVGYRHSRGSWKDKWGGETVLGLITLATPHHGTPGANKPGAVNAYFPSNKWREHFENSNLLYWFQASNFLKAPAIFSDAPNRSDLRWDNYDGSISINQNEWLPEANTRFKQYSDRVILYAGALKPMDSSLSSSSIILDKLIGLLGGTDYLDEHTLLSFADGMLYYGLGKKFGYTDGMVPYKSAMLCDNDPRSVAELTCSSRFRIRRFEFGDPMTNVQLPNAKTLSITRSPGGFDHKEMYENGLVLKRVIEDLLSFVPKEVLPIEPPIITMPNIPTLFLFDVSGSMNENDKIGQARMAGLDALREMKDAGSPPTSIMTFSGDQCGGNVTKKLIGYTTNMTAAENTMRSGLPPPNGGTPIPQARDAANADILAFLNSDPRLKEGRIILLSDGQSTCGAIRPPGVFSRRFDYGVTKPVNSRVRYFTIGFDVPAGSVAERDLQFLASESGGKYYNAADREQLIMALRKQVRRFLPRVCKSGSPDLTAGIRAFGDYDYPAAAEAFRRYSSTDPTDLCGIYDLALAYEASDHYKKAGENYQRYLTGASSSSPDRARIQAKISEMNAEYAAQLEYYNRLIASDLEYLNGFYKTVFNRSSGDLAAEYDGFIFEKREFYVNLPDTLEIDERWLSNDAKDISSSLDTLAKRRNLTSFDRDAVSLLTTPIGQIEDMLDRLRQYRTKNVR